MTRRLLTKSLAACFLLWIAAPLASMSGLPQSGIPKSKHSKSEKVGTYQNSTTFRVTASRFIFKSHRDVSVTADINDLEGSLGVRLNKPIKARLGVKQLHFQVRVLDADGIEVQRIGAEMKDGARSLVLPISFPRSGRYRLLMENRDLDASPARVTIDPSGRVTLDVIAGTPMQVAQRRMQDPPLPSVE